MGGVWHGGDGETRAVRKETGDRRQETVASPERASETVKMTGEAITTSRKLESPTSCGLIVA
jgi:hypothetical protein